MWYTATSASVTNGSDVVTITNGDDISIVQENSGLVFEGSSPVEVIKAYIDIGGNKVIQLARPWPYSTKSNQPLIAYPTDADFAAATSELRRVIDSMSKAGTTEAQAGTDDDKFMTPLKTKQAIDFNTGTAAAADITTSTIDATAGRLLKVGDFGISGRSAPPSSSTSNYDSANVYTGEHKITPTSNITLPENISRFGTLSVSRYGDYELHQTYKPMVQDQLFSRRIRGETINDWVEILHTGNTTVDSNGFIKEASPIVKVFANSADFNSECPEDANYEKPSTGVYLIKNTLGLAKKGWYIEIPKDVNGNVKNYVEYSEFENGDIEVRAFKPDYSQGFCGGSEPMDIPEGRWIDLRLEKPDKSDLD